MVGRFCAILNFDVMITVGGNAPDRICWLIALLMFEAWLKFIWFCPTFPIPEIGVIGAEIPVPLIPLGFPIPIAFPRPAIPTMLLPTLPIPTAVPRPIIIFLCI